ncbi:MAG: peptide methionine sulfoxide reductase [Pseudomonadota bacterium]
MAALLADIERLPEGYAEGLYQGVRYGITKTTFTQGRSFKVYARALNGTDFISLNYYRTARTELLKPCEMPEAKVVAFLQGVVVRPAQ